MGGAAAGVGLAQLPEPIVAAHLAEGKLVQVLDQYAPRSDGVFIYFPSRAQVLPKLRVFIEHMKAQLPWLRGA